MSSARHAVKHNGTITMINKREPEEWLTDDSLTILRGMAMQSSNLAELAARMNIAKTTLEKWRKAYPEIREATCMGRADADAWVIANTFNSIRDINQQAAARWWRFFLAGKALKARKNAAKQVRPAPMIIIDPVPTGDES